jgi:hypothetical protein
MDAEQLAVLGKAEEILERAHEVARKLEERTRELLRDDGPPARPGQGEAAPTDALGRNPVRPARRPVSH